MFDRSTLKEEFVPESSFSSNSILNTHHFPFIIGDSWGIT